MSAAAIWRVGTSRSRSWALGSPDSAWGAASSSPASRTSCSSSGQRRSAASGSPTPIRGAIRDVPSHLYSFSFVPNPEWSHTYSGQQEIRAYLHHCAEQFGLRPHLRTGVALHTASWREDRSCWELETNTETLTAGALVSAMGPLTEPKLPDVPGIESERSCITPR